MPLYKDQLNRSVNVVSLPQRIVSLVPSQTELLYHLQLEENVIGITKFCVHPAEWHRNKTRIGGTKNINIEKIKTLKLDLIIANKEENNQAQILQLETFFPVWVSDVNNLDEALNMIAAIGDITGKGDAAKNLLTQITKSFTDFEGELNTTLLKASLNKKNLKTAYLIWKDPYMAAGGDTFINDMLEKAGFENIFKNRTRYPEVEIAQLQTLDCDIILLSSEPYPFKDAHVKNLQLSLPNTKILLADGEMFSWYGSRMVQAPQYFRQLWEELERMA